MVPMASTPVTTMAAVPPVTAVMSMPPVISRISPPWIPPSAPEGYVILSIVGILFYLQQVYLLDQEIGKAILDLPHLLDLCPYHGAGEGHLAPISIDHAVEKARVEGQEATFGHIGINGLALAIQRGLIDLEEGPLLFVDGIDDDAAQQDHLTRIGAGIFEQDGKADLRIYLLKRSPRDDVGAG
jgi:hypothetical protein